MNKKHPTILLFSMLAVVATCVIPLTMTLYAAMLNAEETKLFETAKATLKPIADLASKNINGANTMKLRNAYAENLYKSSDLLYIDIEGTSKKIPDSDFAPAQGSRKISHTYMQNRVKHGGGQIYRKSRSYVFR